MKAPKPAFTIGIEEEYLLVDRESRDVANDPPEEIFQLCESRIARSQVDHELLRSQIEVDTCVCETVRAAVQDLERLRRLAIDAAAGYGLAPIAASTHPFASWHLQRFTDKPRFHLLENDMQSLSRRLLICGMHVHVGIENNDLRVELMNRFAPFLPLLLALSTSSPFWEGENSGLRSYRLTVFDGFPRTGLPPRFASFEDYRNQIDVLRRTGVIPDPTFIWWDMRISARYPTLESRITDVCPLLADAASIAALVQSILHYLYRTLREQQRTPVPSSFLIEQNRWRAMRYGLDEGLVDFGMARVVSIGDWLEAVLETVGRDADELGCAAELQQVLDIPKRGTSAHRQVGLYDQARFRGKSSSEAFRDVVDLLIEETALGINAQSPLEQNKD